MGSMDDETRQLLVQIRDLPLEQLELSRRIHSGVPPWLGWRFGVRQLLAVITLVAVVLAVIAVYR